MGYLLHVLVVAALCVWSGSCQLVSQAEFNQAVTINGYPTPTHNQWVTFINGLAYGLITTRQQAAMALTQFMHESAGLTARREWACQHTGCPEHYRTPGCDAPGQFYFGRGYIQLTWCGYNYLPFSMHYFGDDRLRWDPDAVARDDALAWNSAFWFWRVSYFMIIPINVTLKIFYSSFRQS